MLYATTRSKVATYTAQRALKEERAPDGGFYIPTRFPYYDRDTLLALLKEQPTEIVARILNEFFRTDIGRLDVEFALGKRFYGIRDISHRIFIGELWNNRDGSFRMLCHRLTQRVSLEAARQSPAPGCALPAGSRCFSPFSRSSISATRQAGSRYWMLPR